MSSQPGAAERDVNRGTARVDDTDHLRRVFSAFPSGVTAVAALVDGSPVGIAASSFTSVSLCPAYVSICVAHSSTTWPVLRTAGRFGVSVLSASQEQACRQLGSRAGDRFAALSWQATPGGAVLMNQASAWFECGIEQEVPVGDHNVVLMRVLDLNADLRIPPLVFQSSRFHRLDSVRA
ncbi:oxidoreductase [Frankia sp. CcI49]|uniref:flavin reductase family protein n=1 Tax=Frankia sp. CcI49 TaxID=1745382 RepID=UPI0009753D10|nr:flavin reductase family protein [Frankia sp. CcI49]ONH50416.1 oxidoreductase [Frankia sp. CcI49]